MAQVNTFNSWQKAKVTNSQQVASNIKEITFELPCKFIFTPGQYIKVRAQFGDQNVERYYSVSNVAGNKALNIAVEWLQDGLVSATLHQLHLGDTIEIKGPMGQHFHLTKPNSLFISGGIGIAPFMSIDENVAKKSQFLSSFKSIKNTPWLEKLRMKDNLKIFLTREQNGSKKIEEKYTLRRININDIKMAFYKLAPNMRPIYICGSTSFVESMKREIVESELNEYEIFTEMFG